MGRASGEAASFSSGVSLVSVFKLILTVVKVDLETGGLELVLAKAKSESNPRQRACAVSQMRKRKSCTTRQTGVQVQVQEERESEHATKNKCTWAGRPFVSRAKKEKQG